MFKVGDRVEVKGYEEEWDGEGVVKELYEGTVIVSFSRPFPRNIGGFLPKYVHKIGNPSPVRTVTRREIVPGDYGKIRVKNSAGTHIAILNQWRAWTSEELREAAHIFNQLAEALEDKS